MKLFEAFETSINCLQYYKKRYNDYEKLQEEVPAMRSEILIRRNAGYERKLSWKNALALISIVPGQLLRKLSSDR